jgi:3-oxoacyl-[acyl-carrier-protein] synthase-3
MDCDVIIKGTGRYAPERIITNDDWSKVVDTNDEWITTRTGIKERHWVMPGETSSYMAEQAALKILASAGVDAAGVELIIVPTVTPERVFPATASILQGRIGASKAACFDINAACSGFVFALNTATAYLKSGQYKNALVIGSEIMSILCNHTDRNTCVLFGDAAAGVYLEAVPKGDTPRGVQTFDLGSDGTVVHILYQLAGGSGSPSTPRTSLEEQHYVYMEGQEVFKRAVRAMSQAALNAMERGGVKADDIKYFLGHQANMRIIDAVQKRLGVSEDRVYRNIQHYGNTTSASIPLCIDELNEQGKLQKGDKLVLFAFGAGLTWGACYLIWD